MKTNIIFGIAGWSGSGKTELMTKLINNLKQHHDLQICAIKHAHDSFKIDHEGKDTYKFSVAGANKVIISSKSKIAMIEKVNRELSLRKILANVKGFNVILVEGWKKSHIKKIEVCRKDIKMPLLYEDDPSFVAVATDEKNFIPKRNIKILNLNNIPSIASFILEFK